MPIVLYLKDDPYPYFEVLDIVDKGRKLEVRPLYGHPNHDGLTFIVGKAAYRQHGYTPKEIDDAQLIQLRAQLRAGEENLRRERREAEACSS